MQQVAQFDLIYDHFENILVKCGCDIIHGDTCAIIVFTERKDNPGRSVTNSIEKIIKVFLELYPDYDDYTTIFVERHEDRPTEFDRIILELPDYRVSWKRITGDLSNQLSQLC